MDLTVSVPEFSYFLFIPVRFCRGCISPQEVRQMAKYMDDDLKCLQK